MRDGERDQVDLWLAFAAGEGRWIDGDPPDPTLDRVARLLATGSLLAVVTWATVWTVAGTTRLDTRQVVLLAVLVAASAVLGQRALARTSRGRRSALALALERVALASAIATALAGVTVDLALLGVWPLGVFIGADLTLTSWALGLPLAGRKWRSRFLRSYVHAGVAAMLAIAAAVLADLAWTLRIGLLYATFLLCVEVAAITIGVLAGLADQSLAARGAAGRQARQREHELRGHWLHDIVLNRLRGVRLRLEHRHLDAGDIAELLDDFDHELRLQQLEEFFATGRVRLAEVVSPALRRAQQREIVIHDPITVETGGVVVPADTGRLVERAVSVFVGNAIQAGSPSVSVRLHVHDDEILVEVEDAGGGFDLADAPVGRGLDRLRVDLGPDSLTASRTSHGMIMLARVGRSPA